MDEPRSVRKHMKAPDGTTAGGPVSDVAPTRLHRALTSHLTRLGLPVAGAGGLGAWLTADVHQMNTATAIASASFVGVTVAAHLATKCAQSYIETQPEIIEARSKAAEAKIKAETRAEASKARLDMQRTLIGKLVEDPANAAHIERVLIRQDLVALAQDGDLSAEKIQAFGTLLANYQAGERIDQNPPNDEGGELRALGGR